MKQAFEQINQTLFISGFADEISSNFEEQLRVCQELGINYVSLRGVNGKNIGDVSFEEAQTQILPKLVSYGMSVSSIGSPIGKIDLYDEEAFQKQCDMLKELCAIANLCGTRYIRIFSFYPPKGSCFNEAEDEVVRKLAIFIEIAKAFDVVLLHENEKEIFGDVVDRCVVLFKRLASKHFKAIFDPANFVQVKEDPLTCYEKLKEYIVYIHIKDACYADDQNVVCGSGDGKLLEILDLAISHGYKGFLTLEPHLVIFDSLKDLEQKDVHEIIRSNNELDPKDAYQMQYLALLQLLKQIGGYYEKN